MAKKKKEKKKAEDEKPKKKAKAKPREEEEEFEEEEYSPIAAGKPKLDIYVGLSAITFVALVAAAVFFYLDVDAAKTKQPPIVSLTLGGLQGGRAPVQPQQPPRPNP